LVEIRAKLLPQYIVKYISNLKKIINICLKNGWLTRDPFLGYKMNKREVVREILTQEDIDNKPSTEIVHDGRHAFTSQFKCNTRLYLVPGSSGQPTAYPGHVSQYLRRWSPMCYL
jgi:hypothetical protein